MEKEGPNLPAPHSSLLRPSPEISSTLIHSIYTSTSSSTTSTTTSSSSSSPPTFLRHVQAAFKRHRPLGTVRSNNIKPRRRMVPTRENSKPSEFSNKLKTDQDQDEGLLGQRPGSFMPHSKQMVCVVGDNADCASITPSEWGYTSNKQEEHRVEFDGHDDQPRSFDVCQNNAAVGSNNLEDGHLVEGKKRVHFASASEARFQGADGTLATGIDDILSHMGSLALTEMEWDANENNHVEGPKFPCRDVEHHNIQSEDMDGNLTAEGRVSSSMLKNLRVSDQLHQFRNFAQDDMSYPLTQSSEVGTSYATSTLINPGSAPVLNSTTYCSKAHMGSNCTLGTETSKVAEKNSEAQLQGDLEMNLQARLQREVMHDTDPASKCPEGVLDYQATAAQMSYSNASVEHKTKQPVLPEERRADVPKNCHIPQNPSEPNKTSIKESTDVSSGVPMSNVEYSDQSGVKLQCNKSGKLEKGVGGKGTSTSRKKNYDADLFFKVNGKLYQRLGKIGSGGSSEVHKVISSDCTIYALKKIKLKGRDYATAYGFCQEIEYLKKLKGMNNIIQLIDYEVTDKALLHEVINGSQNNKDGRVRDDGFIYMVLEYGEIDLAHMLSHKWKELDSTSSMIDENWLRFYWQQILLAVNTIHEERIVHSDLKPANFLLVRGSLKLIDFGIAKAIMSDTTNIQRDSQVGTLSYMSPEAFMCNETDANGNTIKCGRPSDIWSLGCILYQMVYGRTPFSGYKTFWAKFKVITDPNHEIIYEPVSNPWLLDLMKNCLAWDRNQRWRIPQLLQHPFLVPPIPAQISTPLEHSPGLLKLLETPCKNDPKTALLFSQLEQLLVDPRSSLLTKASISLEEQRKLLRKMSNLCLQLDKHLGTLKESDINTS